MFSVLYSVQALRGRNIMADKITVSGGIAQSDWTLQAIADIFDTTVAVWGDAPQGSAYGAALMALYGHRLRQEQKAPEKELPWPEFLEQMNPESGQRLFQPIRENVATCQGMFNAFRTLVESDYVKALNMVPWVK
jgi:sugar (pentulose or hexulose) kinase